MVFFFHFDHFFDLGFGTIVDGVTSETVMGQKKFWVKPKMAIVSKSPSKSLEDLVGRFFPFK